MEATANDCRIGCTSGSRGEHWSDSCMPEQSSDNCTRARSLDSFAQEGSLDSFEQEDSSDIQERTLDIVVKRQSR